MTKMEKGRDLALIVDDQKMVRAVGARFLQIAGRGRLSEVIKARDLREALVALGVNSTRIAVVLTDVGLVNGEDEEGFRVVEAAKALDIPHVAVWSGMMNETRRETLEAIGADVVFAKPMDLPTFMTWFANLGLPLLKDEIESGDDDQSEEGGRG